MRVCSTMRDAASGRRLKGLRTMRLYTRTNPDFFEGTAHASKVGPAA